MSDVKKWRATEKPGDGAVVVVVDATDYDALAQRCRELERDRDDCVEARLHYAGLFGEAVGERDTLRAEVADLKARLLEAERGNEELVRLRAERREMEKDAARYRWLRDNDQLERDAQYPGVRYAASHYTGSMFDEEIDKAMEAAACARTTGPTTAV